MTSNNINSQQQTRPQRQGPARRQPILRQPRPHCRPRRPRLDRFHHQPLRYRVSIKSFPNQGPNAALPVVTNMRPNMVHTVLKYGI